MNDAPPPDWKASPGALVDTLKWLFDKVAGSQAALLTPTGRLTDREINRLIAIYSTGAGAAGFVTNIGGLLAMPITMPANLVGVAAIQLKLIGAIAAGRGHDTDSEEVRTVAVACMTGGAAIEILKEAGIQLGLRLGQRAVNQIAAATLARINQRVGFQLVAKAGSQGLVNLSKALPIIGGVVGGTFDAASTRAVGAIAKRVFAPIDPPDAVPLPRQPLLASQANA